MDFARVERREGADKTVRSCGGKDICWVAAPHGEVAVIVVDKVIFAAFDHACLRVELLNANLGGRRAEECCFKKLVVQFWWKC